MEDEYIIEEEGEGSSSRRPFLIAVLGLTAVFILAAVCSISFLLLRPSPGEGEAAAIIATNEVVAATNEAVTQTIAAMKTEAARPPTETTQPPATDTAIPQPTNTPKPTNTRVVTKPETAEEETITPNFSGTSVFESIEENTPTPIAAFSNGNGDLPQTGINTWGALVAAFILIATLVTARRLRSS